MHRHPGSYDKIPLVPSNPTNQLDSEVGFAGLSDLPQQLENLAKADLAFEIIPVASGHLYDGNVEWVLGGHDA